MTEAPTINAAICERLLTAAVRSCPSPSATVATPPSAPQPEWDSLANSFAALSAAFTWGTLLLGLIALLAGVVWGYFVKTVAEREARLEANACAKAYMEGWLANEAPQMVRAHVELLRATSLSGTADPAAAADEMGEKA